MLKKHVSYLILIIMLALLAISMIFINRSFIADPEIYIWNESGQDCELNYFANTNGKWSGGTEILRNTTVANAEIKKIHLYQAAEFYLTVGNKVGHFYCSTDIKTDPFQSSIQLSQQEGACYTLQLNPHQLAIVIIKPRNDEEKKLLA